MPSPGGEGIDAGAPQTTMRVAHLAPDIGAIDFCYQAAKTGNFIGPVLRGPIDPSANTEAGVLDEGGVLDADVDANGGGLDPNDGGEVASIVHRTVSKYVTLNVAGPLTVAIVGAGATSCASPLFTGDVTLDPAKLSTVVFFGGPGSDGGQMLSLAAFTDDRTTADDKARVRVIHAALGTKTKEGTGPIALRAVAAATTPLADRVEPKRASTASQTVPVDALGYASVAPIAPPTSLVIGPASSGELGDASVDPWQSQASDLGLVGGSLHTAFVLSGEQAHVILWCADKSTRGSLSACTLLR